MRRRERWRPARNLRAEFGERRLNRAVAWIALRLVALAGLCLVGSHFLIR